MYEIIYNCGKYVGESEIDPNTLKYDKNMKCWIQYPNKPEYRRILYESQIVPNVKSYFRQKKLERITNEN